MLFLFLNSLNCSLLLLSPNLMMSGFVMWARGVCICEKDHQYTSEVSFSKSKFFIPVDFFKFCIIFEIWKLFFSCCMRSVEKKQEKNSHFQYIF